MEFEADLECDVLTLRKRERKSSYKIQRLVFAKKSSTWVKQVQVQM